MDHPTKPLLRRSSLFSGIEADIICGGTEWIFASMNTSVGLRTRVSPPSKSYARGRPIPLCRDLFPAGRNPV